MSKATDLQNRARGMKAMSVFYLVLVGASLLLVHGQYYEPAVSYVLLYLAVAVVVTASVAMVMLPKEQYSVGFTVGMCLLLAASVAMLTFFSGGLSSELYLLFLPLLGVVALHRSWQTGVATLVGVLFFYSLAILPGLLSEGVQSAGMAPTALYRLGALFLIGAFVLLSARGDASSASRSRDDEEDDEEPTHDARALLRQVEKELSARRGVQVSVVLVDPGQSINDVDLLLERVAERISPPTLVGEDNIFGFVLSGVEDRDVEGAARRAIAAASSLGAKETRAGAAIYPRDARSANDLLNAAGQALEAAFEVEAPSAIVLSGRSIPRERNYRAAR